MQDPTVVELQEMARSVFGREISEDQAEAYRGRLPAMARIVRRIRELEPRLRGDQPPQVMRIAEPSNHD